MEQYGLPTYDAGVLVAEREVADWFEQAAKGRDAKQVANWVITELFGALNRAGLDISRCPIRPEQLGRLLDLLNEGRLSGRLAKEVFAIMFETGQDPDVIVEERGLVQVTDAAALEPVVEEVIPANPKQIENYRKNPKVIGWFVGQVMRATGGRANPQLVKELLEKKLDEVVGGS
ncbi:Aspartyl/glutamyl-tRNA(Asn/Gln) amidotransferase subunit B [bacterium HR39]|nr:Aspartyl/glutamyl-tRNA(Asn/Gln) amidotransferase subunit B [bacterium HR39]